jgi:hypothetical protein
MSSLTATAHPDIAAADVVLDVNTIVDAFGDTASNGWGSPDIGPAYDAPSGGSAANYSVGSGTGQISNASVGVTRIITIDTGSTDHAYTIDTNFSVAAAATSPIRHRFLARYVDTSNYYFGQLELDTSNVVRLTLQKNVAGSATTLVSNQTVATNSSNDIYRVTVEVAGTALRVTAYNVTDSGALVVAETTDSDLTAGTRIGVAALAVAGNTNGTFTSHFDNLTAGEVGGLWHVNRVYPDGSETELLGSPVYPSGGTAVLWDTVLPLDVPIFYRATNASSSTILTSNTITVTGSGQGWLKDPVEPIHDILLGTCPASVCPLDVDNDDTSVSLLRIGQAQFASAAGVFPIIDAARSRTVAQTRKARESSLAILSHTLVAEERVEDILASGRNLYLQLASRYGWARRTWYGDYIAVADATEERPPSANMTYPHRAWGLPFGLARPPFVPTELTGGNGVGVSGATYGDATATGRTYAQRTATGNTYLDTSRGENL